MVAVKILEQQFAESIEGLPKFQHALVGCSGGADSTALCLLLRHWLEGSGGFPLRRMSIAIVDHGLRKESRKEAESCAQWLKSKGFSVEILVQQSSHSRLSANIQAMARQWRFRLLFRHARAIHADCLMLAHHHDDQIETVLDRLERGSHLVGLSAMAKVREQQGITIMRPLMDMRAKDLRQYCQDHATPFVDDPSNQDLRFKRVKNRQFLRKHQDIFRSIERLQRAVMPQAGLELAACRQLMTEAVSEPVSGLLYCHRRIFDTPEAIRYRLMGSLLRYVAQGDYLPRYQKIVRLTNNVQQGKAGCLGGVQIRPQDRGLWISREVARLPLPTDIKSGETKVWDGRWKITAHQNIRLGFSLKRQHFADVSSSLSSLPARLPASIRASLPCVFDETNGVYPLIHTESTDISKVCRYEFMPKKPLGEDLYKSGLLFDDFYPISFFKTLWQDKRDSNVGASSDG